MNGNSEKKRDRRITILTSFFILVCFVYLIRIFNIFINAEPVEVESDTYKRYETIQAVRGEIYDRDGTALVSNEYRYDFILDSEAMSANKTERNYAIIQSVYAIRTKGLEGHMKESSFPFDGTYPNYTYSSEARDPDSNIYYRLLKRIALDELEEDSPKKKDDLTASYLETFYAEHPEEFPTEQEIVDYFLERYEINAKNRDDTNVFSDDQIDILLRTHYDMEVADFSAAYPYVFARDVSLDFITYVKEIHIVGADFEIDSRRVYNYPGYASHILGRVGSITADTWQEYKDLGYDMDDIVGLSGCEYAFEEYLRGIDGIRVIEEDKQGNIVNSYIHTEAVDGKDVYLTLDIDLQMAAEDALRENVQYAQAFSSDADSGAIVAIDPNNGELLAIASYPTYDLSTFGDDYNELAADSAQPLYNRALLGLYAPGSTFKVGMVAAGISNDNITSSTLIDCEGKYDYYDDYKPNCWIYPSTGMGHGKINAAEALRVSCNCYFYELGRIMGIEKMNEYCTGYGFGCHTGIELAEYTGILAGPEYRNQNGGVAWRPGDTITAAIGQSDNTFTPIQLSVYISTVLNGGTRYSAHLLKEVKSYTGESVIVKDSGEILGRVNLSDKAVDTVKEGMRQMAQSDDVTRYLGDIPVTIGGKTGTAELGGNIKENGLFVCAAPYNDPEIVVTSIVENAGSGSRSIMSAVGVVDAYYKLK